MGNIWKRSLSMFLAMVMVFGMLPIQAFAEETGDHTHAYGEWSVTTPATAEAEGEESRACACGEVETRAIAKLEAHSHAYEEAVTAPTCVKGGYTTYTCACGDSYVANETAALGHTWGEWTVTTPATVDAEGVESRTCAACGEVETRAVAKQEAHSHAYEEAVTAPTCVEGGYTTYTCACGDSYVANETAALGHTWGDWAVTTPATVDAEGVESRTCACGAEETRVIGKLAPTLSGETRKVYFLNVEDWAEVYAVWSFDEEYFDDPAFPGEALEADGELENVWFVELPVEADAVCFNDGVAVTEELLAWEAENQIEAIHAYDAVLDEELDYYDADRQEAGAEVTWLRYADLVAEKKAAEEAAAAVAEVQAMIDALPTVVTDQATCDGVWESIDAIDAAAGALTAEQQAQLDYSNYNTAMDAAAAFTNPEFGNDTTWEENKDCYFSDNTLYIKDGVITEGELYSLLVSKLGATSTGKYNTLNLAGYYIDSDNNMISNADKLVQIEDVNSTDNVSLTHGQQFYVHKTVAEEKYGTTTTTTTGPYTIACYYNPSLTESQNPVSNVATVTAEVISGNDATVTLPQMTEGGWSAKVSAGTDSASQISAQTVKLSTSGTTTVTVGPINSTADATITVEYIKATSYAVNVTVATDTPWGTASASATSSIAGETITITATPNAALQADDYAYATHAYSKITVDGVEQTGLTFTMPEKNVDVVVYFTQNKLESTAANSVGFNGWYASGAADSNYPLAALKTNILTALGVKLNGTAVNDATIQFYPWYQGNQVDDWCQKADIFGYDIITKTPTDLNATVADKVYNDYGWSGYNFGERAYKNGASIDTVDYQETVLITVDGLTIVKNITLTESREAATIEYTKPSELTFEDESEIRSAVLNACTTNGGNMSAARTSGTLPGGGQTATLTYTVSVEANEKALANSRDVEIDVKAQSNPANITFETAGTGSGSVNFGGLTDNGTLAAGTYNLTVTPSDLNGTGDTTPESAMYVEKVEVKVDDGEYTALSGSYSGGVYSASYAVSNDTSYTIKITYGTRTIPTKDEFDAIAINRFYAKNALTNADNAAKAVANLRRNILTAVGLNPADGYAIIVTTSYGDIDASAEITDNGILAKGNTLVPDGTNLSSAFAHAMRDDSSRSFTISLAETNGLPAVSKTVTLTIEDSRVAPSVVHTKTDAYTVDVLNDAFLADVEENITVNGKKVDVTVALAGDAELPGEGMTDNVKVTVTVGETAEYLGVTKEITVKVTNKQHLTTLTVTLPDTGYTAVIKKDNVTVNNGTALESGEYTIVVTPDTDNGYFVDGSKVGVGDDENHSGRVMLGTEMWTNYVYSLPLTINNHATEDTAVTVTVGAAQRKIVGKTLNEGAAYQVKLEDNMDLDALKDAIYNAVVDTTKSSYAPAETPSYEITGVTEVEEGEYQVTITYPGNITEDVTTDIEYPAVSGTFTVKVSPDKTDVVIPDVQTVTITESVNEAAAAVKQAILTQNSDLTADDVTVTVASGEELVNQGGTDTYTVNIVIKETAKTKAYNGTRDVSVKGEVKAPVVNVNPAENGTVSHDNGVSNDNGMTYTFTLTPNVDYYIESLSAAYDPSKAKDPVNEKEIMSLSEESAAAQTKTWEYADESEFFADGKTKVRVFDGTGLALGVVPTYTFTAKFVDPSITIPENGTMTYYYGMEKDTENLEGKVMEALGENITFAPETLANAETDILYKARGAATYTYTVTINPADFGIPFISSQTVDIPIEAKELWVKIGTAFDIGTEPTNEDIQNVVDELTEKYSITELINMFGNDQDQLKALIETELKNNQAFVNFYTNYGAHYFGEQEKETVKLVIEEHEQYGDVESNECELTLTDTRTATSITANPVEITYGFTEEELLEAMGAAVMANGTKVGTPKFVTNVVGLGASEEAYTIKLKYAGSEAYKPSEGETTVTVKKAPVDVFVDNRLLHWEEGLTYTMPVSTDPAGVATIKFIAGLDISGMNYDGGIKGLVGDVQLMLPEGLQTMLEGIGLNDGMSMTLSELKGYLDKLGGLFTGTEYEEMVNVLMNMINSLPTDAADIKVTIGGQLPTNIGVYLVGAVSADGNYETDFGVGAVVIYPNGKRAELDWIVEDDNSIITQSLLAGNPPAYDMGAVVTKVYEGTIEAAQSQVVEIFFGVDVDGNIKLETDQSKLNVGAYTEVAMIANWGNELYYAEPLIRAFVVVAESLNVEFIDENGNVNNERLFTFNNEVQSGMENLRVTYKNGDKTGAVVTEYNVKYLYAGAQTNGIPYASETAPTHAGTYAITAIVTLRDTDNMVSAAGAAVGALVIEPAQATIDVKNVVTEYTGNAVNIADMITVSSEVENLTPDSTVITAGINTDGSFSENGLSAIEGDVNIDFPAWVDEIIAKSDTLRDGMSVAELVAIIDKVDAAVSEYEIEGYELEIFDRLKKVLAQLPQDAKLTFKDADQLAYSAVGTYLVVGIVTDSDFYPAMDAGALVIYPNVELGTLEWKNVDKNNIFYLDALTPGYLDAKALFGGVEDTAVDPAEIYIGVDADNWLIHLSTQQPDSVGVYTEIAVLNDTNSNAHYALPIIRPVIIVDGIYDVLFHDEKGQVNHDRLFTYDGTPKEIGKIYVYGYDKGFYKEEVPEEDELKVLYIGTDSTGDGWFREEAPTDAGVYTVVATYTDYENGEIVGGGAGMGTMVIAKADMALDMKDTTVTYDGKGHFVDVTSEAADPDYLTVIVDKEKNTINFILEDDLTIAGGAVKTLLEEALGRKLDGEFNVTEVQQAIHKIIDQIEAFEIPEEVKAVYDELPAALQNAIADLKASAYDPVEAKLDEVLALIQTEVPQSGTVIFNGDLPVNVGEYQFYGFALSENYEPEATQGVLTIAPVQVKVTADDQTKVYGADDPGLTYTVKYYDHEGNELYDITTAVSVKLSREAGEDVGAYEITAKATVADRNFSVAEVKNGTLTITPAPAAITVDAKTKVYGEKDPEWTYTVIGLVNGDTEAALNIEISRDPGEEVGTYAITATASNNNYVIQITNSVLTILEASVNPDPDPDPDPNPDPNPDPDPDPDPDPEPEIKENLIFNADDVAEVGLPDNLYVDGKPVAKDENGNYILSGEKILAISYKFHVGVNAYETYPTNMYVWELTFSDLDGDGKKETYVADRIKALDDILLYKGTSIRVNDPKGDGIRFFTLLTMDDRDMLLAGKGLEGTMLEGYTLSSYGTLFGKSEYKTVVKDANGVPQQASVAYGVGYINGAATFVDSIFDRSTGLYTGMLTELPHDFGTLYGDFFSRGYLTLKNAEGEEYHLYNGEIRRSIYYVATQNNCYWSAGSDFDNYIEGLISAVENAGQPYEKIYCKTCGK